MGMTAYRLLFFGLALCVFATCFTARARAADKHPLPLSSMQVEIISQGKRATFRLYDTRAAKEFYVQLPLTLDLTNFRDAQWMFYPPRKLNVKPSDAYHDGKRAS